MRRRNTPTRTAIRTTKTKTEPETDYERSVYMQALFLQSASSYINLNFVQSACSMIRTYASGFLNSVAQQSFLQENRGWVLVAGAVFGCIFLMSVMWQFVYSFILCYVGAKTMLWFLEHYEPAESDETVSNTYMSESSASDIIEYVVGLIIVYGLSYVSYVPFVPGLSIVINALCVILSIVTLASKNYRQKLCFVVKNLLVSDKYDPNADGETNPSIGSNIGSNIGTIHAALQKFCYTVETLNIGSYNIMRYTRSVVSDLKAAESYADGLKRLTSKAGKIKTDYDNDDADAAENSSEDQDMD